MIARNFPQSYWAWTFAVVMIFCLVSCSGSAYGEQLTEDRARELTRARVDSLLGGGNTFLQITRDRALENLVGCCLSSPSVSVPYIFRVSTEGEERIDAHTVISHITNDGGGDIVVVVSAERRVFIIRGAIDSAQQFNNLADELHIKLSNSGEVQRYLEFYLSADTPQLVISKLHSADEMKELTRQRFTSIGDQPEATRAFTKWWRKHAQQASKLDFDTHIVLVDQGFVMTFYVLSDLDRKHPKRGPGILLASIDVSSMGHVGGIKFRKAGHS